MRNPLLHIVLLLAFLLSSGMATAEIVHLKSGGKMVGTIVFQNEEVVVIKDASGARFQYLMTDVDHISAAEEAEEKNDMKVVAYNPHKVAVSIQLAGGLAPMPQLQTGGCFQADLVIGTAKLLDKHILLGGGFGYHATFLGGKAYSFLPIQLRAEVPFIEGKHTPLMAAGVGYGIAATKGVKGGLFAGIDLGWMYRPNEKHAIFLGLYSTFQNAQLTITETIDGQDYTSHAARNICNAGIKLGLYF